MEKPSAEDIPVAPMLSNALVHLRPVEYDNVRSFRNVEKP